MDSKKNRLKELALKNGLTKDEIKEVIDYEYKVKKEYSEKTEKELAKAIITAVIFIVLFVIATKGCSMI